MREARDAKEMKSHRAIMPHLSWVNTSQQQGVGVLDTPSWPPEEGCGLLPLRAPRKAVAVAVAHCCEQHADEVKMCRNVCVSFTTSHLAS